MNKSTFFLIPLFGILIVLVVVYVFLLTKPSSNQSSPQIAITPTIVALPTLTPAARVSITQSTSERDERFIEDYTSKEARLRPDITITNNAPFENDLFRIETQFVVANPGYFKVLVFLKTEDRINTEQEVAKWLKSLGIPDESLGKLKIEYTLYGIPKAE